MPRITRYVTIGEETEYAVESENYTDTVDPSDADLDSEDDDKLIYEGIAGVDRVVGLGTYSTGGTLTMPLDDVVSPWFFKWALGGYTVNGTAPSFTHIFEPAPSGFMPSFSAKVGKDLFEHVFLGNVIESISIEAEDEWAELSVDIVGARDKSSTLAESVTFTEGNLYTAPMGSLEKDGVDMTPSVSSVSLTIDTGASVEDSAGFGSRFPRAGYKGSLEVELELTLLFNTMNELTTFWGAENGPSENVIQEFGYTLHFGENIDFYFPRMIYTSTSQPIDGRESIEQTVTARALYDPSSDSGPIVVSFTNARESYTP